MLVHTVHTPISRFRTRALPGHVVATARVTRDLTKMSDEEKPVDVKTESADAKEEVKDDSVTSDETSEKKPNDLERRIIRQIEVRASAYSKRTDSSSSAFF